jgi:CheY-like chemotaxis protein
MESKSRILVVDDENAVRASFDRVLSESGYTVRTAADGPTALATLRSEPCDLAFVDLRMPGMDGMEVVRTIRATQPGVQVVVVTGYGTEGTMREAKDLGVFDFVAKPLAPSDLSGLAERALSQKKEAPAPVPARVEPVAAPAPQPETKPEPVSLTAPAPVAQESMLKMAGLLIRGSLLGLAYVMFLPFIGFAMLAWTLGERVYVGLRGAKAK